MNPNYDLMKKLLLFLFLLAGFTTFAQVPAYYNDVNLNLTGTALRDELATKVISTHTNALSYTPGIWEACKATDQDPDNALNVLLIYGYSDTDGNYVTDRTRSVNLNGGNSGTDWNREHTFPNSLASPSLNSSGTGGPPYADAHNLRASDVQMNANRGNKKFATGTGNAGDSNGGWYPGDEWKGDVARIVMYMYLRYGSQCYPTFVANGSINSVDGNMIDILLQWNAEDPVSAYEDARNSYHDSNATYAQGNRNPFIDNPAFATQIWGGPQAENRFGSSGGGDTQAPTIPSALTAGNITQTTVSLIWNSASDNIGVTGYDVYQNGSYIQTTTATNITVANLSAATNYSFFVRAKDAAGNLSGNSNTVSITTAPGGGGGNSNEFFLSEYIEGSSNNKALEIANFTGNTKSLSGYSLRRNVNGGTSWGAAYVLSGTVANGDVYVVANSSAVTALVNAADATTGADALIFNGNDPVGLFKDGSLIDIIGNFGGGSADFAANVTLRRKATVNNPATTYNTGEWDSLPVDTFDGLGRHSITGGDTQSPTAPTGLTASNFTQTAVSLTWNSASDNIGVTGYDLYQNGSYIQTTTALSVTIANLSAATSYNFYVQAKDAAGNVSGNSNIVNVTTLSAGGGSAGELFLSEYIEGSSNNKALEIANFTGSSKSLSGYSLRRNVNGGTSWGTAYLLSGTVENGDVYVVANSSAAAAIVNVADATTGADALIFNGNDPVGLFKDGSLIDIIGNFGGGSADFAANVILRRKATVNNPATTYNVNEWDSFPVDTFDGLGTHNLTGSGTVNPATTLIQKSFFETGMNEWIDGGGDCDRYSGSRSFEGSYSIRLRDNSGVPSSVTSKSFDLSLFDTVEVRFYFNAYSMENGEDFWLEFNNGSGFTIAETFVSGTDFNNDTFYSATVTLSNAAYNFGSLSSFRFQCDASSNADQIYIDQVTITGINNSGSRNSSTGKKNAKVIKQLSGVIENDSSQMLTLYPVPANTNVTLIYESDENANYRIVDLLGRTLTYGIVKGETLLDTSKIGSGIYFVIIEDEDEITSSRFIKN